MFTKTVRQSVSQFMSQFAPLGSVPSLHESLKKCLKPEVFEKYLEATRYQCEVFSSNNQKTACGLIAYKSDLGKNDTLTVRSFKVIDSSVNSEEENLNSLLKRVAEIARQHKAFNIMIDLPNKSRLIGAIKKRGFVEVPEKDVEYAKKFTHFTVETSALQCDGIKKSLKPEENQRKRKRDAEVEDGKVVRRRADAGRSTSQSAHEVPHRPSVPTFYNREQPYGGRMTGEREQYGTAARSTAQKVHKMPMKGAVYLEAIMNGIKQYEGRVNGPAYRKFQVGDELRLFDRRIKWGIRCKVTALDVYTSFRKMLEAKGVVAMLPQLKEKAQSLSPEKLLEQGEKVYRGFPGSHRVSQSGCVAIGVKFIEKITTP